MSNTSLNKGIGLPETLDLQHQYTLKTKEYGIYRYWYKDVLGNYWAYTNAPEGDKDHNPHLGEPLLDLNQPLPHTNPEFFTQEGFKRNMAVSQESRPTTNPNYNAKDLTNIWYEFVSNENSEVRFVYLDKDVKENPCLWAQQQLKVADASITAFRQTAAKLFQGAHPKDKHTAACMILVDQGYFSLKDLVNATVEDLQIIDKTVILFGKKFVCDDNFFDYITTLLQNRQPGDPLFTVDTSYGKYPLTINYLYYVFYSTSMSEVFLRYWHANHVFSRSLNRLHQEGMERDQALEMAIVEVANVLSSNVDVMSYIDSKLMTKLMAGFEEVQKSISVVGADAIQFIHSDLTMKRPDEAEFSEWVQSTPMHLVTDAEQAALDEHAQDDQDTEEGDSEPQVEPQEAPEGAV